MDDRTKRLDSLQKLVRAWSERSQKQITDQAAALTRLLEGRGAGAVGSASVDAASKLVGAEIDAFLQK